MKVLFAHSFFMAFDDKQRVVREPYPPLGTLIAAACAREQGHEVALFDAMLADSTAAFSAVFEKERPDAVVFFEDNFNWLSKMCLSRMRAACQTMIRTAKSGGAVVTVAGSDASDFPETYLRAGADYAIKGEAEFRIVEILGHHQAGEAEPYRGPGIHLLEDGEPHGLPEARGERNLSVFPRPAWDLVDMEAYRREWLQNHGYFSLNMTTTRGCPYRCNWCAKPIHGRRYDVRQPEETARELFELKRDHQPDHIWFTDDIFGLKPKWVARFAAEVARLDARVPFKIQARADLMNRETVAALRDAGCRTVWMGVESGSQKILDAMDKDLNVPDIHGATKLLQEAGIEVCFFLQLGYPGETAEDIRQTWEMVATLKPDRIGISVAYPLPGTKFYQTVENELPERDHWAHSQHMRPIHRATYPAAFYPQLYHYLHHLFRKLKHPPRKGLRGLKDSFSYWRTRWRLRSFGVEGVPFS